MYLTAIRKGLFKFSLFLFYSDIRIFPVAFNVESFSDTNAPRISVSSTPDAPAFSIPFSVVGPRRFFRKGSLLGRRLRHGESLSRPFPSFFLPFFSEKNYSHPPPPVPPHRGNENDIFNFFLSPYPLLFFPPSEPVALTSPSNPRGRTAL